MDMRECVEIGHVERLKDLLKSRASLMSDIANTLTTTTNKIMPTIFTKLTKIFVLMRRLQMTGFVSSLSYICADKTNGMLSSTYVFDQLTSPIADSYFTGTNKSTNDNDKSRGFDTDSEEASLAAQQSQLLKSTLMNLSSVEIDELIQKMADDVVDYPKTVLTLDMGKLRKFLYDAKVRNPDYISIQQAKSYLWEHVIKAIGLWRMSVTNAAIHDDVETTNNVNSRSIPVRMPIPAETTAIFVQGLNALTDVGCYESVTLLATLLTAKKSRKMPDIDKEHLTMTLCKELKKDPT